MKSIFDIKIAISLIIFTIIIFGIGYILFGVYTINFSWFFSQLLVIVFFAVGSYVFISNTKNLSEKKFIRRIFFWSLFFHVIIVFFNYYIFIKINGIPFFATNDPYAYYTWGELVETNFKQGNFNVLNFFPNAPISDLGGKVYYGVIYYLFGWTGIKIIIARLFNALFTSLTIVYFYKIIRFFNDVEVARRAAIFYMFFPLFILHAGMNFKEPFFMFLIMQSIYQSHKIFLVKNYSMINVFLLIIFILSTFFFRSVIGPVLIFSLSGLILFNLKNKLNIISASIIVIIFLTTLAAYQTLFKSDIESATNISTEKSVKSLVYQAKGSGTGKLVANNLMSTPVMAVITFISPFPTIIQKKSQMYSEHLGVNIYISPAIIKIFFGFWMAMGIYIVFKETIKQNIFILLFFFSYLAVIVISLTSFKIRYQMPILPFFLYFATIGMKSYKKYFTMFLLFLLIMTIIILYYNYKKISSFGIFIPL